MSPSRRFTTVGESLELKALSFLASEFKKIILAANQNRYLIVFDSKRETEGKSKQVLDEILAKLKNKSKLKICAEEGRQGIGDTNPGPTSLSVATVLWIFKNSRTNANMYKDKDKCKYVQRQRQRQKCTKTKTKTNIYKDKDKYKCKDKNKCKYKDKYKHTYKCKQKAQI